MKDKTKGVKLCVKIVCLLCLISTSVGCLGARETDQLAFVLAIGFDKAENNQQEVTITIANTLAFSSTGGSGGQNAASYETVSVKAPSAWETGNLFNSFNSRELAYMHTKVFVIGEETAKDGIEKYLTAVSRFREARGNSSLYICKGKAKDFLMNNKPVLETSPAKQIELVENTSKIIGYFPVTTVNNFLKGLKDLHSSPVAGLVGIHKTDKDEQVEKLLRETTDPLQEPYYAGAVPRTGGNKAEFIGTAVFKDDKMVGVLSGSETRTMLLLQGKLTSSMYNMTDPKHDNFNIAINLRQARKPEIRIKHEADGLKIEETVFLEGEFVAIESGENYEGIETKRQLEQAFSREVEKQAKELIAKTKEQNYGDIFQYDRYYRKELATWEEWKNLNWKEIYDQTEINIICKTNIRRPGFLRQTLPILRAEEK